MDVPEIRVKREAGAESATPVDSLRPTTLTRRGFVQMGGALFVSLALPAGFSAC